MNHSQSSMLQSLKQQQSGFSDMQLQQQLTLRKMQELQRQQQLRQLDARQQDAVNIFSPFAKQGMGNYPSPLINGAAASDSLNNPWGTELVNMNWLQRASPLMQGSSNGLVYANHGQGQHLMGVVPQQGDQSLYGVPVSGLRGNVNQFAQLAAEKPSMQQMETFGNSVPGNQYNAFTEQANVQDGPLITRQRFPGGNFFGHSSSQALSPVINMETLQQVNPVKRNAPLQEVEERPELAARDKTLTHVASSQVDVALDPTEERILFGSDDNVFASFGKSSDMSGDACGPFDGGGLNGIPSLQSGTWSALMQSAVAETSGSDTGPQDEWSSLNFQNPVVPSGNEHPAYSENQQASFSNDLMGSSLTSSAPTPNNRSTNNNYQNVMESQQSMNRFAGDSGDGLQANFSERHANRSEKGSTWSNAGLLQNAVAEVRPIYGKVSLPLDAEANVNSSPSGHWTPVQTGLRQQSSGGTNGWNILPSVACSGDASVSMHESENSSQHSQGSEQKRVMHAKDVHGNSLWNSNSIPFSTGEGRQAKSPAGIRQGNCDGFSVSSAAGMPTSSITGVNEDSSKYPSNSYLNYWQNVNPTVKSEDGNNVVLSHHHVNKDNQAVESSLNSCDREESVKSKVETCDRNDSSSFNHPSNFSLCNSGGGLKEHSLTDVGDSRYLPYGKQKPLNQIGPKNSGPLKFEFRPMGNLDENVEPSNGMGQHSHSMAMTQQITHVVPSKIFGQVPESSAELAKGQSADQKDAKDTGEAPTSANASITFNQPIDMYTTSKDSHSSNQNMLELLHKVDQSREHGPVAHYSSSECNLSSEMPEAENSECSVDRLQWSLSSASQGFGLQLGPPPRRTAMPNQSFSSQSSLQTVNTMHQSQSSPRIGEKGQSWFNATSLIQSSSPSEKQELKDDKSGIFGKAGDDAFAHKAPGGFIFDIPHLRSELHYRQLNHPDASHIVEKDGSLTRPAGQNLESSLPDAAGNVQNFNSSTFGGTSEQSSSSHPHARSPVGHFLSRGPGPVSQHSSASGIPQQEVPAKVSPKMWYNVPGNPHLTGMELSKVSAHVPQMHPQKVLESTSYASHNQGDQYARTVENSQAESAVNPSNYESSSHQFSAGNVNLVDKLSESQGHGTLHKNLLNVSSANSASMQKDLEVFGRSLKSNNLLHQNLSLLNQMQGMKATEPDPNDRPFKRMKGPEGGLEGQHVAPKSGQLSSNNMDGGDTMTHRPLVPSGDLKMLSFSGAADDAEPKASSQHSSIALQNLSRDNSQSNAHGNDLASVRVEPSLINPQMAPTWFNHYGTFRNGHSLAGYDAHRGTFKEPAGHPFTLGNSSSGFHTLNSMEQVISADVGTGQGGSVRPSSIPLPGGDHFSLAQSLPLKILKTKKRERATCGLISWQKEVSQGSQDLQTISMAEVVWAKAANRLTERVGDEFFEDGPPLLRARRRLTLTTQLMQQLLHPPNLAVISSHVHLDCEGLAYSVSRSALGDACGLVSQSNCNSDMLHDGVKLLLDKHRKWMSVDEQHLLKVIEDFMSRARKLEIDFLRLDKRASVLDLRIESQELEKFSVINRFAKFHGRGQAESGDSSSSADAAANSLRPCLQRYVTALPMPRNLPDRVQCLSL